MPANGLFGHIRNNALKSALLMAGFVVLIAIYWWAACLIVAAFRAVLFDHMVFASVGAGLDELAALATAMALARWSVPVAIALAWFAIAGLYYQHMIRDRKSVV